VVAAKRHLESCGECVPRPRKWVVLLNCRTGGSAAPLFRRSQRSSRYAELLLH
jgi:hypothetical protein